MATFGARWCFGWSPGGSWTQDAISRRICEALGRRFGDPGAPLGCHVAHWHNFDSIGVAFEYIFVGRPSGTLFFLYVLRPKQCEKDDFWKRPMYRFLAETLNNVPIAYLAVLGEVSVQDRLRRGPDLHFGSILGTVGTCGCPPPRRAPCLANYLNTENI